MGNQATITPFPQSRRGSDARARGGARADCEFHVRGGRSWLWSGSLALLADAGHMLADAGALALALVAQLWAARARTAKSTFGYRRAEVLAAFVNASRSRLQRSGSSRRRSSAGWCPWRSTAGPCSRPRSRPPGQRRRRFIAVVLRRTASTCARPSPRGHGRHGFGRSDRGGLAVVLFGIQRADPV